MFLAPGAQHFEGKEEEGDADEPIEIIVPVGVSDFVPEILSVTAISFLDDDERVLKHAKQKRA